MALITTANVNLSYSEPSDWLVALAADSSLADQAIAAARSCGELSAPSLDWAMVLGLAFWQLERYSEGLSILDCVDHSRVNISHYFALLGMVCRQLPGQESRALASYLRALELEPNRPDIHYNIGNLLKKMHPGDALSHYRKSLRLEAHSPSVWHNYGSLLNDEDDQLGSLQALHNSLQLDPENADAWCSLGLTMFQLERFLAAQSCFQKSIALDQCHARSHINFGQALIEVLQPEKALQYLQRGVDLDSSSANSLWNLGLAFLLLGHFKEGWQYYEVRFHTDEFGVYKPPTSVNLPPTLESLSELTDSELIVWSEQGIGDGIQFCRYLPMLKARNVKYRLLAHAPLLSFYKDWMGLGDQVCLNLDTNPSNDSRPNISMLSLPYLFQTELSTVPSATPYLRAPGSTPPHLSVRQAPGGLNIGVAWASNPSNRYMYRHKSIPLADLIQPLIDLVDLDLIELHSLQVGSDVEQLDPWRDHQRVFDWNDVVDNFSDTAYVINQLDLVISVDTAVAHLAGALNKQTWLLLPHNADFRWLHQRDDSPWYPTMRLFRQKSRGDWQSVISELQAALNGLFILDLPALADAKLNR
jgi:tetratricopeptide (TPR) repeat protein